MLQPFVFNDSAKSRLPALRYNKRLVVLKTETNQITMNTRSNITPKLGFHRNQSSGRIEFPLDQKMIDLQLLAQTCNHESSKTTEIYTQASKLDFYKSNNPLDKMFADSG
jgi:hypothetical protein